MKTYTVSLFFLCFFQVAFSQDTAKINNDLLLDYYQSQRFADAAAYLKKVYPEPIHDIKILRSLAYCSQMEGKLPEAEEYYKRIYKVDSTSVGILFNLGSINLSRGNFQKAGDFYKQIILKDSTNFIAYKQLGTICLEEGDIPNQIKYLQTASQLNPDDPDVASQLSDLYVLKNSFKNADKILTVAINADPENVTLLQSLVKLDYREKKWTETTANCEKLMQLGDRSGYILTQMGIAYYNMREYVCGIESFDLIADIEQTETSCYYAGACCKRLKQYDKAIKYFLKAIELGISPNTNSYYTELADTYETIKKYKKADFAYQKALQFTLTPLTYYSLANMYDTEVKDQKKAVLYYNKYLATKPSRVQNNYVIYAKSRVKTLSK